jgi:hypothetical protein
VRSGKISIVSFAVASCDTTPKIPQKSTLTNGESWIEAVDKIFGVAGIQDNHPALQTNTK